MAAHRSPDLRPPVARRCTAGLARRRPRRVRPRAGDRPVRSLAAGDAARRRRRRRRTGPRSWSGAAAIARRGWSSSTRPPRASPTRAASPARRRSRPSDFTARDRADRSAARPAHLLPRALPGPRRSAPDQPARVGQLRHARRPRRRRATSPSPGRPTRSARAGASIPTGAACGSTRRCAARSRTSSSTAATPSTPTAGRRRGEAGRRDDLEERGDGGEVEGGAERRRLPRRLPVQPRRRAHAPLQRRRPADRAVGRPRGPRQLVSDARPLDGRRSTRSKSMALLAARARQAFLEYNPVPVSADETGRIYRTVDVRPAGRGLRARPAQLSRPEQREPPADAGRGVGVRRADAARLAQGAARGVARDLEGHRQRHADRRRSCPTRRRTSRRSPTATTARRSAASWRSPTCCGS